MEYRYGPQKMTEEDFNAWKDGEAFRWFAKRIRDKAGLIEAAVKAEILSTSLSSPDAWAAAQIGAAKAYGYVTAANDFLTMEYDDLEQ
jgi:hypothetical protein